MTTNSVTIHVMVQDRVTGEQWVESWVNYKSWVDEAEACQELTDVMMRFNTTRRPYENHRDPISFVLEEVKDVD